MKNDIVRKRLGEADDSGLWDCVLHTVFKDIEAGDIDLGSRGVGTRVEVGACSHWTRPNQYRWTAAGGFAAPEGYGHGGMSRKKTPHLHWSVQLVWDGEHWVEAEGCFQKPALQVAVPSRSRKHPQAAVRVTVLTGKENSKVWYGFRNAAGKWSCVAVQDIGKDHGVKR